MPDPAVVHLASLGVILMMDSIFTARLSYNQGFIGSDFLVPVINSSQRFD